jgi:hypothetical protein
MKDAGTKDFYPKSNPIKPVSNADLFGFIIYFRNLILAVSSG